MESPARNDVTTPHSRFQNKATSISPPAAPESAAQKRILSSRGTKKGSRLHPLTNPWKVEELNHCCDGNLLERSVLLFEVLDGWNSLDEFLHDLCDLWIEFPMIDLRVLLRSHKLMATSSCFSGVMSSNSSTNPFCFFFKQLFVAADSIPRQHYCRLNARARNIPSKFYVLARTRARLTAGVIRAETSVAPHCFKAVNRSYTTNIARTKRTAGGTGDLHTTAGQCRSGFGQDRRCARRAQRWHWPAYYEPPPNESRDDRAWNFARADVLRFDVSKVLPKSQLS
jgi:hypothetical protein